MARKQPGESFFRRNGLSLVFGALMLVTLVLHAVTGWRAENQERALHDRPPLELVEYVEGGAFQSTMFENWESEFLQMGLFVLLTVSLRQKGSSESRKMNPKDEPRKTYPAAQQPWAARQRGVVRVLYEHSLSIALFVLFALSFVGHLVGSWRHECDRLLAEGEHRLPSLSDHLASASFWFESMQNWQSEFLAVLAIVVLSIYLREKDSSQSKQVEAPHSETGI